MNRRKFLEEITAISALAPGLALLPALREQAFAEAVHARAKTASKLHTLNAQQDSTVTCIAGLLLPETDTIGANAVGVNRFIDALLSESMLETQRDRFLDGLAAINARCRSQYGTALASARRADQEALLRALDAQLPKRTPKPAERAALAKEAMTAEGGFALLKALVVYAYFTSEPVAKGLINAPVIPGKYDGCVPL